ncbi:hypothetical protein BHE74_00002586 [Ensete ventricosum]|nr:hypothetical protein BHE74_00002586 [Ensete ventricosum]
MYYPYRVEHCGTANTATITYDHNDCLIDSHDKFSGLQPLNEEMKSLESLAMQFPPTSLSRHHLRAFEDELHREIVYPCIPYPDGEDGGQASSSLAVSTRWTSTMKLLQSDLATLAQREGEE